MRFEIYQQYDACDNFVASFHPLPENGSLSIDHGPHVPDTKMESMTVEVPDGWSLKGPKDFSAELQLAGSGENVSAVRALEYAEKELHGFAFADGFSAQPSN